MDPAIKQRNKQRVDQTFRVIDLMEDIRDIWRETAPLQEIDEARKENLLNKIKKARKALDGIEASL
ncbi:MAG TPA: hypothetical protein PLQ76_04260 [bacterium]|nr:hypothetical protein [bacterium]